MEVQLTDSRMIQALYLAIVSLLVFLYVYVRRLEVRMSMLDAAMDTLLAEPAPSDFLPGFEDRLRTLETTAQSEQAGGEAPPPGTECRATDTDDAPVSAELPEPVDDRKKAVERHILAALMENLAAKED
tara:strand:- start:671 stop:1057 length:387 start_codon:yes stop_codon:yes gene_type:complete